MELNASPFHSYPASSWAAMHEPQLLYRQSEITWSRTTGSSAEMVCSVRRSALVGECRRIFKVWNLARTTSNPAFELATFRLPLPSAFIGPIFPQARAVIPASDCEIESGSTSRAGVWLCHFVELVSPSCTGRVPYNC